MSRDTYLCPHKLDSGEECGYSHTCATKFEHHLRDKHYGAGIKHQCPICGYVSKEKFCFDLHMRNVHEGVYDHLCNECGKSFSRSNALKEHIAKCHAPCTEVCPIYLKGAVHAQTQ